MNRRLVPALILLVAALGQGCRMFVTVPPLEPLPKSSVILRDVEYTPQESSRDCGPACVTTLLRYHGSALTLPEVTSQLKQIKGGGVVPQEIIFYARKNGFHVNMPEGSINYLRRSIFAEKPLIIFLHPTPGIVKYTPWRRGHYAVAVGYDDGQRHIILHTGTESFDTLSYRGLQLEWGRANFFTLLIEK